MTFLRDTNTTSTRPAGREQSSIRVWEEKQKEGTPHNVRSKKQKDCHQQQQTPSQWRRGPDPLAEEGREQRCQRQRRAAHPGRNRPAQLRSELLCHQPKRDMGLATVVFQAQRSESMAGKKPQRLRNTKHQQQSMQTNRRQKTTGRPNQPLG